MMRKNELLLIFFLGMAINISTFALKSIGVENLRTIDWATVGKEPELVSPYAPPPAPTPPPIPIKLKLPLTILIIGDSMILEGLGPRLEDDLITYKGITVVRDGEYSTGLNRRDYFDWATRAKKLIDSSQPEVMIAMFGANDGQNIRDDDGRSVALDSPNWDLVYMDRVRSFMTNVSPYVKKTYWVGQPIARTDDFKFKFLRMNKIYQEEAKNFSNITYISTWEKFSTDGKYTPALADDEGLKQLVKEDDGVHLTLHGAKIMSQFIIGVIKNDLELVESNNL